MLKGFNNNFPGINWRDAKKAGCLIVVDFDAFEFEYYRSRFEVMEQKNETLLSEKLQVHFFDIKKHEEYRKLL